MSASAFLLNYLVNFTLLRNLSTVSLATKPVMMVFTITASGVPSHPLVAEYATKANATIPQNLRDFRNDNLVIYKNYLIDFIGILLDDFALGYATVLFGLFFCFSAWLTPNAVGITFHASHASDESLTTGVCILI